MARSVSSISTEKGKTGCLRGKALQVVCALAANVISLSFGISVGWSSAVGPELEKYYSAEETSWIITSNIFGALAGVFSWSQLITSRIGPQKSGLVVGIVMLIAWCLLMNISIYWCLLLGRIAIGVGMGGLISAIPEYIADISEDSVRGTIGSIMVLTFNIGTLIAYGLGGLLNGFYLGVFAAVVSIVFTVVFFPCPESPYYLLKSGHSEAARRNLEKLRWPRDIDKEFAFIYTSQNSTDVPKARWSDIFRKKAPRKALGISIVMVSIQQISGIIPLLSYVGAIFKRAGGSLDPVAGSCVVGAVQILGSILGVMLIERAGRRFIMIFSCFVMAISHGFLGYALMPTSPTPGWLPVTSLSVFMIAYAMGAGSAPYVIMTELSSPSVRAMITSIVLGYSGVFTFLVAKSYTHLIDLLGVNVVFWMYAVCCAAGGIFTFFFLPETAGRSNASIQEELEGKKQEELEGKVQDDGLRRVSFQSCKY